jgi:hypothetical protein
MQLVKKSPASPGPEVSLLCSQEPATGPDIEPDEASPQLTILFP